MPTRKSRRNILVTGGYGFVGSNLFEYLVQNPNSCKLMRAKSKQFNIAQYEEANALFKAAIPDVVIHLAAKCGGIGANMKNPADFWASNLAMAANVLDACINYSVDKLIVLGTVCSYPTVAPLPFKEDSLYTGWPEITNRPYGVAKLAIYEGCRAYQLQYGLNYTYLIPTNMYGLYDDFNPETSHVIPAMIRKFHEAVKSEKESVTLWGDGSPSRDFLHVRDCARAIKTFIDKDSGPEPYNLGSGKEISMKALAELVASVVGFTGHIIWDANMPNGQPRRAVDSSKVEKLVGWKAEIPLLDGIQKTYNWFKTTEGA